MFVFAHSIVLFVVLASRQGHRDVVELLIERGAMLRVHNNTAEYGAAKNGHADVVELFLKHGSFSNTHMGGLCRFVCRCSVFPVYDPCLLFSG